MTHTPDPNTQAQAQAKPPAKRVHNVHEEEHGERSQISELKRIPGQVIEDVKSVFNFGKFLGLNDDELIAARAQKEEQEMMERQQIRATPFSIKRLLGIYDAADAEKIRSGLKTSTQQHNEFKHEYDKTIAQNKQEKEQEEKQKLQEEEQKKKHEEEEKRRAQEQGDEPSGKQKGVLGQARKKASVDRAELYDSKKSG